MAIIDVHVTNTDRHSHCHKAPNRVLEEKEKENKWKYLEIYHKLRKYHSLPVCSINIMSEGEEILAKKEGFCSGTELVSAIAYGGDIHTHINGDCTDDKQQPIPVQQL